MDAVSKYPAEVNAQYGESLRVIYHWPLMVTCDTDELTHVECDYCGHSLWDEPHWRLQRESGVETTITLDYLYRAVSQHRLDGCPNAPTQG